MELSDAARMRTSRRMQNPSTFCNLMCIAMLLSGLVFPSCAVPPKVEIMNREKATTALRDWVEDRSLCVTGRRLDGNRDALQVIKSVPGDPEFRKNSPYRVDTFHRVPEDNGVITVYRTSEFFEDPDAAIDVLSSADIDEFYRCPEPPRVD